MDLYPKMSDMNSKLRDTFTSLSTALYVASLFVKSDILGGLALSVRPVMPYQS